MVHRPGRGLAARRRDARRARPARACSTSAPRPAARRLAAAGTRRPRRAGRGARSASRRPCASPRRGRSARAARRAGPRRRARNCRSRTSARFDAVLVDAPCSGLGTLRQHPEIRWRRQPADVAALAALQTRAPRRRLLPRPSRRGTGLRHLHDLRGGERRRRRRLPRRARRVHARRLRARFSPPAAHDADRRARRPRTFPHRHGLDGFFARASTEGTTP